MPKYDNCKNCVRLCEYAGKDRKFVCPNGESCKVTVKPVCAFGWDEMITQSLRILDLQRAYCIDQGAEKERRWFPCYGPGDLGQNSYYNGHMNMIECMLLPLRKGVEINEDGKHYLVDLPD